MFYSKVGVGKAIFHHCWPPSGKQSFRHPCLPLAVRRLRLKRCLDPLYFSAPKRKHSLISLCLKSAAKCDDDYFYLREVWARCWIHVMVLQLNFELYLTCSAKGCSASTWLHCASDRFLHVQVFNACAIVKRFLDRELLVTLPLK